MNAPRLFVDAPLHEGALLALPKPQSHYLASVMRLNEGDAVLLFNGSDGEFLAHIVDVARKEVTLGLERRTRRPVRPGRFGLAFAPIKRARMEFLAEKATELGAGWLQPVITQRAIVREVKDERLRAAMIEAAEQSERIDLPELRPAQPLARWLEALPASLVLLHADEGGAGQPLREVLPRLPGTAQIAALIGPEGGFTEDERAAIAAQPQAVAVGLGPRVLRADTAGMAMLACMQAFGGDWDRQPRWHGGEEEE